MALKDLLSELEREISLRRLEYTNSYINQPELITISSESTNEKSFNATGDSFFNFTCDLLRPAIGAKSIQLLSVNIPQCQGTSFNNTELLFPYYRIRTQKNINGNIIYNETPNINNLYYVRLLPSYYPTELIPNAQNYGFNKTFNNYQELSDELSKSCANDLRYTNVGNPHFLPNDVSVSYNPETNRFQMKGNNVNNRVTPGYPPNWAVDVNYLKNDIVFIDAVFYIALADNINFSPTISPEYWRLYTGTIWNTYLVANYNDPNVLTLQKNLYYNINATDFNITTTYALGDVVYYNNTIYDSLIANNVGNNPTTSPNAWVVLVIEPNNTNPDTNFGNPDFFYGQYDGNPTIIGIPNPPFNKGKNLAKRLGFTWGGQFVWDSGNPTDPLYYNATNAGSGASIWNRLRPVPDYEYLPPQLSGPISPPNEEPLETIPFPNNNPLTATTFGAEAYCNLVYTSILNLYSDITTASTIDTQSTRNILALIPVNCGALGIAFVNNYLENPLAKINRDIYQIRIELRDESGEPYYISNNGTITLTLKINY